MKRTPLLPGFPVSNIRTKEYVTKTGRRRWSPVADVVCPDCGETRMARLDALRACGTGRCRKCASASRLTLPQYPVTNLRSENGRTVADTACPECGNVRTKRVEELRGYATPPTCRRCSDKLRAEKARRARIPFTNKRRIRGNSYTSVDITCPDCGKKRTVAWSNLCEKTIPPRCQVCSDLHRRERITKKCQQCGKEFVIWPSREERSQYCSVSCKHAAQQTIVHKVCRWCGGHYTTIPSRADRSRYCSRACRGLAQSGVNNPAWRGGIKREPYPPEFFVMRHVILSRDEHRCVLCDKAGEGRELHVHHIDYNKRNNSEFNLIALCCSCHGKTRSFRPTWYFLLCLEINLIYSSCCC